MDNGDMTTKLPVKVVPASSRNCIRGWLGDVLKVSVSAPPERGKANAAVEKTVADALHLPTSSIVVVAGKTSARKVIEITGLSESEVYRRLCKDVA